MDEMDEPTQIGKLLPTAGQWAGPKLPPAPPLQTWQAPASEEVMMSELSRCLTLCAPTGMTLDDRTEWLTVAVGDCRTIPAKLFMDACQHVRTRCDHPAKLIPAIHAYADEHFETFAWRNRPATSAPRLTVVPAPTRPKISQREIDQMEPELIELGLSCGALVKDESGKVTAASNKEANGGANHF